MFAMCLQCFWGEKAQILHHFFSIINTSCCYFILAGTIKYLNFVHMALQREITSFTYIFPFLQFVAHPNCQQLLASLWYEGLPGFRRHNIVSRLMITFLIGFTFPLLSLFYLFAPKSRFGKLIRKPFIKFICHSASYITFLGEFCWLYNMKNRELIFE